MCESGVHSIHFTMPTDLAFKRPLKAEGREEELGEAVERPPERPGGDVKVVVGGLLRNGVLRDISRGVAGYIAGCCGIL